MALVIHRQVDEGWRDCARRYAEAYGLEQEVLYQFDELVEKGYEPRHAAFIACYDWDVCEYKYRRTR